MGNNTSVSSQPSQVNRPEEFANWKSSVVAFHTCIFFLITVLGFCLQLKFTTASPSVHSRDAILMKLFIIDITAYCGSFGVFILQTSHSNTDFGKFMYNISLLLGTLACILELLILFPIFGWVTLFFWSIYSVTLAVMSNRYSKRLCESAVAGLGRAYEKLEDLIKTRLSSAEHGETKDQNKELQLSV